MQIRAISRDNVQMLTSQRKQAVLAALARDGQVVAKELSVLYGVSEDTLRRDLRELAAEGLLLRVHGGALPASAATGSLAARTAIAPAGKAAIARAAAGLLQPGGVAILDGGTTALQLAAHLPPALRATVITHSPQIACALEHHPGIEVVMLGGRLFRHSMVGVGAAVMEQIGRIRADLYFMGVTGVHAQAGLTTGDYEEACVKRALAAQAAETVVLASAEKLGCASRYKIGEVAMASAVLVERSTPQALVASLRACGPEVRVA
jgi:DeoR/GlpR family transcriptional regulator of sugar metabolism